ncbi:MAG: hypothetical protein PHW87_07000 [Methanothrix sp.]|nr:hypothetical protein [Methanothrix sp.]
MALKNLGAILSNEKGSLQALYYKATALRDRSTGPADVYRLAFGERRLRACPEAF